MTLNFYTLGVIYLVYSFLGWVAETVGKPSAPDGRDYRLSHPAQKGIY